MTQERRKSNHSRDRWLEQYVMLTPSFSYVLLTTRSW